MSINNPIANLFGSSPIKPIQKHMAVVANSVNELDAFFNFVIENDWKNAELSYNNITKYKTSADGIIRELRKNMPKGLFMPVSRTDLITIIETQQRFALIAQDISSIILERQLKIPKKLRATLLKLVTTTVKDNQKALNAINELDEILEAGFSGHVIKVVKKLIKQIDQQLVKVEINAKKTRLKLMSIESDISPIDAMFLYQTIKNITSIARLSKEIGNYLELLIAK